jgi:hypothetical protein
MDTPTQPIDAVYLDMDGVLVDFCGAAMRAHGSQKDKLVAGQWHLEHGLGIGITEFWAKLQGHSFWEGLGWLPDGRAVFDAVAAWCGPTCPLWLLSSPSDDIGSFSGKYAWLQRHLPEYRRRLILCADKAAAVSRPGALLIDDSDDHCKRWRGTFNRPGGESILLPRWWNSDHALAGGVDGWCSLPQLKRRLENYRAASAA